MKLFGDRAGWLRATLLGLLLLVFLGAEIPELHDHEAGTPGLYNEECPLARLAVSAWGVPVVAADTLLRPDPALDPAAVPSSVDLPAPPRTVFAARAPPAS
jgi:hypothetical protein